MMAESEQKGRRSHSRDDDTEELETSEAALGGAKKPELDSEVDSLLDEIDDVLETNAEEFVRSFVQKGGQ
jgi:ubiquitin-like protein Pup